MKYKYNVILILFVLCIDLGCSCSSTKSDKSDEHILSGFIEEPKDVLYVIQIPHLGPYLYEHQADRIESVVVRWIKEDGNDYLELVRNSKDNIASSWRNGWFSDHYILPEEFSKRKIEFSGRWLVKIDDDNIKIGGCYYSNIEGYVYEFQLEGKKYGSNFYKGVGTAGSGIGAVIVPEMKDLYKIQWRMFASDQQVQEDISLTTVKLTREPPVGVPTQTEEEIQSINQFNKRFGKVRPPITMSSFRLAIGYLGDDRLRKLGGGNNDEDRNRKRYARDKILPDIDWSEVLLVPESLIMIDHIATVKEDDLRNEIANRYCRVDGSGQYVIGKDLTSWTKVPLLFLLVHYTDWLTPERMEKLAASSKRMRLLMDEIKKYGKGSPEHLDEIMVSVLSKMSAIEQRDYFVKSLRLRDYVGSSTNESLRKLLPNDLPPPPGPPANMRTWTVSGHAYQAAFVSLDESGVVLTLIDIDKETFRVVLHDTSKEDQAYVKEQLAPKTETPKTDSSP